MVRLLLILMLLLPTSAWAVDLGKANFLWTAPVIDATHGAPTSYTVKCGTATGGPYTLTGIVTAPSTTEAVSAVVTTAGTYFCVVTASNTGGESVPSAEITFQGAFSPLAPSGLMVK